MEASKVLWSETFGKAFVPKKIRPYIKEYFLKAGYNDVSYSWFGYMFWTSVIITMFTYLLLVYPKIQPLGFIWLAVWTFFSWVLIQGVTAAFLSFLLYFHLNLKVYKRTKVLEDKLPDYLNLVSVNLKGGMSFEKALWSAIKPEFEVLAKEITIVSKRVMTGNDVKEALGEFAMKYDSSVLRRSMDLLIGEIEGGGKIVDVIDNLVANLKKTAALKAELQVATKTYMIFISAIVVVIAPALFAVSYQLLLMITSFTANLSGSLSNAALPFTFGGSNVSPDEFKSFSYFGLGIIATFSAMIVSIIDKGDIKGGLKYIPIFLVGSLTLYYIFSGMMGLIFGGMTLG